MIMVCMTVNVNQELWLGMNMGMYMMMRGLFLQDPPDRPESDNDQHDPNQDLAVGGNLIYWKKSFYQDKQTSDNQHSGCMSDSPGKTYDPGFFPAVDGQGSYCCQVVRPRNDMCHAGNHTCNQSNH